MAQEMKKPMDHQDQEFLRETVTRGTRLALGQGNANGHVPQEALPLPDRYGGIMKGKGEHIGGTVQTPKAVIQAADAPLAAEQNAQLSS